MARLLTQPTRLLGYHSTHLFAKMGRIGIPFMLIGFGLVLASDWTAVGIDDVLEARAKRKEKQQ